MGKRKILILIIILSFLLLGLFAYLFFGDAWQIEKNYVRINGQKIEVEIADTPVLQKQGLSKHPPLGKNQGMLFVFTGKQVRGFWMKEMLFPLDIIWINDNRIVKISADLPPEGAAPVKIYSSDSPVNYVLEVNAGWADRAGIKIGDAVEYHL